MSHLKTKFPKTQILVGQPRSMNAFTKNSLNGLCKEKPAPNSVQTGLTLYCAYRHK